MSLAAFGDVLSSIKANERPETVLIVADDADLIKLIVAWTNTSVTPTTRPTKLRGGTISEKWGWLWQNVKYSRQELIQKSGLAAHEFDARLRVLIGNRVIYPDGTVNSFVERYLRDRVLKLFEAKPKRPLRKTV